MEARKRAQNLLRDLKACGRHNEPGDPDRLEVAETYLNDTASQAREQALLEAREAVLELANKEPPTIVDTWHNGIGDASRAIYKLNTPEAQAQVQRRIVAGWLEEQSHSSEALVAVSARGLLAALTVLEDK